MQIRPTRDGLYSERLRWSPLLNYLIELKDDCAILGAPSWSGVEHVLRVRIFFWSLKRLRERKDYYFSNKTKEPFMITRDVKSVPCPVWWDLTSFKLHVYFRNAVFLVKIRRLWAKSINVFFLRLFSVVGDEVFTSCVCSIGKQSFLKSDDSILGRETRGSLLFVCLFFGCLPARWVQVTRDSAAVPGDSSRPTGLLAKGPRLHGVPHRMNYEGVLAKWYVWSIHPRSLYRLKRPLEREGGGE